MSKPIVPTIPTLAPRRHFAALCTGLTCSVAVLGTLVALFDDASHLPWLVPTPDNVARVDACSALARSARDHCVAAVVAAVAARRDGHDATLHLAQRDMALALR